jgi:hypothetical protein
MMLRHPSQSPLLRLLFPIIQARKDHDTQPIDHLSIVINSGFGPATDLGKSVVDVAFCRIPATPLNFFSVYSTAKAPSC